MVFCLPVHAETINLDEIKALSAATMLKAQNNTPISMIQIPTLYNKEGKPAKGQQTIKFTLHSDASTSVKVMENPVKIGETVTFKISANSSGGLDIPIHSLTTGDVGVNQFTLMIDDIRVLSCPSGYSMSGEMCYKTVQWNPSTFYCPANYTSDGANCVSAAPWVEDPNATCRSGYGFYHSYQCIDSTAYASESAECYAAGGMWHKWTGQGMCHFNSPYLYTRDRICSTGTITASGGCGDFSNTTSKLPDCGSSGDSTFINGVPMCQETYSQPAT